MRRRGTESGAIEPRPVATNAMVLETGGGRYRVRFDEDPGAPQRPAEVEASLRGRLKQQARTGDRVVIGDRVRVERVPGDAEVAWAIEAVGPRTGEVVRRGTHQRRAKVMAANLDRMLVVVAAHEPEPRLGTVDRLLVIAESSGIEARVVVNKSDLEGPGEVVEQLTKIYPSLGYPTLLTSAETGEGLETLAEWLEGGISALIGPSGVGKSSLLNALEPSLELQTGALSRKLSRGRHTTVNARLIPLRGGWVADTPGFGDVGIWGIDPERLEDAFPEFIEPARSCRFRGCTHLHEPGCGVRAAVEAGEIPASRLASYEVLHAEAVEGTAPDWS